MKLLKKVILLFFRPLLWVIKKLILIRNFYLANLISIIQGRISITANYPICHQLTRISGQGKIGIGANCSFGYKLGGFHRGGMIELQPRYEDSIIKIGSNVSTNNNVFLCAANYIEIGDDSLLGQFVTIMDHEAHGVHPQKRKQMGEIGKVILGKNVWIGNNVIVLKNSIIGDNSIIAAGAVVSGTFPANVIIGGIPAKIIKQLDV